MAEIICVTCPKGCHMRAEERGGAVEVTGNQCDRGVDYGRKELTNPTRVLTSTVRAERAFHPRLPVKTDRDVPKRLLLDIMRALDGVTMQAPVKRGDLILRDVCGSGANIVATRDLPEA